MILAWKTRKVVHVYSEAEAVMVLVIFYFCLDIIFIPLFFALTDGTNSATYKAAIRAVYICLTASVTLVLLFYCCFYKVYQCERKKRRDWHRFFKNIGQTLIEILNKPIEIISIMKINKIFLL